MSSALHECWQEVSALLSRERVLVETDTLLDAMKRFVVASRTATDAERTAVLTDLLQDLWAGDDLMASIAAWSGSIRPGRGGSVATLAAMADIGGEDVMSKDVEEFAAKLVRAVRDVGIRSADMNVRPDVHAVSAERWRAAGITDPSGAPRLIVPDAVDEALFALLVAIDQGALKLQYVADDGRVVDLGDEGAGELAGWYAGPDGWRARYSKERFFEFIE